MAPVSRQALTPLHSYTTIITTNSIIIIVIIVDMVTNTTNVKPPLSLPPFGLKRENNGFEMHPASLPPFVKCSRFFSSDFDFLLRVLIPYWQGCVHEPIGVCGTFEEEESHTVIGQVVFTRDTVEGYK